MATELDLWCTEVNMGIMRSTLKHNMLKHMSSEFNLIFPKFFQHFEEKVTFSIQFPWLFLKHILGNKWHLLILFA